MSLLGLSQLLFDSVRVGQSFCDTLAPLFQDFQNRLVGVLTEQQGHDDETDYLGEEEPQIPAKSLSRIPGHIDEAAGGGSGGCDGREVHLLGVLRTQAYLTRKSA